MKNVYTGVDDTYHNILSRDGRYARPDRRSVDLRDTVFQVKAAIAFSLNVDDVVQRRQRFEIRQTHESDSNFAQQGLHRKAVGLDSIEVAGVFEENADRARRAPFSFPFGDLPE